MNIIVCVKQVADPEAPAESFLLDAANKVLVASPKVPKVLNPFDEHAVEAALQIKDKQIDTRVTILSCGGKLDRGLAKKPLLMGADRLVLLEDAAFAGGDSWLVANVLAAAIKNISDFDLVLCGRQAADTNAGQVGLGIAEFLNLPSVNAVRKIEIQDAKARVERVTGDGYEVIEIDLPAVITVSNEIGQPRYPEIKNIRIVNQIQPDIWKSQDIGVEASQLARRLTLDALFQPVNEGTCEVMEGETLQEASENLAVRLRAEKIL